MTCISTDCPRYKECARAVCQGTQSGIPYASYGTGFSGNGHSGTSWMCGPNGNYQLFEPLEEAIFIGYLDEQRFFIKCQAHTLDTSATGPVHASIADESCVIRMGDPIVLRNSAFMPCVRGLDAFSSIAGPIKSFCLLSDEQIAALDTASGSR